MTGAAFRTNGLRNHYCDPREGVVYFGVVLQLFSTYHSFAWNVSLTQGANVAQQIVHTHQHAPQFRSSPFKDPHVELQQLIPHRSGTLCIIYRDEREKQETEEQEDGGKGRIKVFGLEKRSNIKLSMEISG